jgi:concanavalin A-like lectin/glucanase superfamily protein
MAVDDGYTVALLHMNGADTSTTFTDEAGATVTPVGNAQIDTGQSKFGGASGQFDGTGDYLTIPDSANWQLDGGSNSNLWTVDFWVRFNGDPLTNAVGFLHQRNDNNNYWSVMLINNALRFQIRNAGINTVLIEPAWNPASATWYHIAIVKNGTSGYMHFVDGTQIGSTTTDTDTFPDLTGTLQIARVVDNAGAAQELNGWMDEVRISKGVARWTSNFTPPTAEYAPVAGNSNFFLFMQG